MAFFFRKEYSDNAHVFLSITFVTHKMINLTPFRKIFALKNRQVTFKNLETIWIQELNPLYDKREALSLFYLALEDFLSMNRSDYMIRKEDRAVESDVVTLNDVLFQLKSGKPYQYIAGFTYFCGLKIQTGPNVLIPRPETEELVQWVLETIPHDFNGTIEDYCTGTGCIALALKSERKQTRVSATDISENALQLAQVNGEKLELNVAWRKENALDAVTGSSLDVLISNPPYIPEQDKLTMHRNVLEYEPGLALFVPDDDPLRFYRVLGEMGIKRLNPGGYLFFEIHEDYAVQMKRLVSGLGYREVELRKDLQGKWRMLRAMR